MTFELGRTRVEKNVKRSSIPCTTREAKPAAGRPRSQKASLTGTGLEL